MSGSTPIPQRARRSESMTGAEALIDLFVSPVPSKKVEKSHAATGIASPLVSPTKQKIRVPQAAASSNMNSARLAEASPLSPRRSKAVAALSGLAGMSQGVFKVNLAVTPQDAGRKKVTSSGSKRGRKKGGSNRKSATKSSAEKPDSASASGRKHGSGPAHKPGADGTENVGRWTAEEHNRFLKGLEIFKKDWKNIAALVRTRTVVQTRTHAQKYFQKLFKAAAAEASATGRKAGSTAPKSMVSLKGKDGKGTSDVKGGKGTKGKRGRPRGKGKRKNTKAKSGKKASAALNGGSKSGENDGEVGSPEAIAIAQAAAAAGGSISGSALAHPHLSMAMSGTTHLSQGESIVDAEAKAPRVNASITSDGSSSNGMDFGSMLPQNLSPSSITTPGKKAVSASMSNKSKDISSRNNSHDLKKKRTRVGDDSRQSTPTGGKASTSENPSKQRKLHGTSPGLSLSISARKNSGSPRRRMVPMSPWISQVKKLPVPKRNSSVRFSDSSSTSSQRISYDLKHVQPPSSGASAFPSSNPLWSTAASRACENNVFLSHGRRRFNLSSTAQSRLGASSPLARRSKYSTRERTPLHTAVASGDISEAKNILAKIAKQGGVLHSPAQSPVKKQRVDTSEEMPKVDGGVSLSTRGKNAASVHSSPAVIEAVNRQDEYGYTPLMVAATLGLKGGSNSSPRFRSASSNSSPKVAEGINSEQAHKAQVPIGLQLCALLLEMDADPALSDDTGMTAIHWASLSGDAKVLQYILVDCSNKLSSSGSQGKTENSVEILSSQFDSAQSKAETFVQTWEKKKSAFVHEQDSTQGKRESTLSSSFIAPQHRASLAPLLSITCRKGDTALHIAARQANVDCIIVLFRAGASSLKRNYACETPYDVIAAALPSDTKAHQRLLTKGRAQCRKEFFALNPSHCTLFLSHKDCLDHKPRSDDEWESPARIEAIFEALEDPDYAKWFNAKSELEMREDFDKANVETLSRVHHPEYIRFIHDLSKQVAVDGRTIPFTPKVQKHLTSLPLDETKDSDDCDTSFSKGSLSAARRAVGAVCFAIDRVLEGKNRNAFCAVRPPGHHAGLKGLIKGATSCGFCIFNNIAAGAFHALERHSLSRVAIVDLDVHHGNGTQEIVSTYAEPNQIFFFSVHLYDHTSGLGKDSSNGASQYEFYPGTGSRDRLEHNVVNAPLMPMWRKDRKGSRGEDGKSRSRGSGRRGSGGIRLRRRRLTRPLRRAGRSNFRLTISEKLVPALRAFNPELILLSSGFDGANGDVGNCLKTGARGNDTPGIDLAPSDFFWATKQIQEVAAVCCEGRIVSVLEGGYGVQTRRTSTREAGLDRSNFARCVMSQIAALVDHRMGRLQYGGTMGDQSSDDEPLPRAATRAGIDQSDSDASSDEGQGSFSIASSSAPPPPALAHSSAVEPQTQVAD